MYYQRYQICLVYFQVYNIHVGISITLPYNIQPVIMYTYLYSFYYSAVKFPSFTTVAYMTICSVKSTVQAMEVCRKSIYDMKTHSVMPGLLQQNNSSMTFTLNNQMNQLPNPLNVPGTAAAAAAAAGDMSQYLQYHLQVRHPSFPTPCY